MGNNKERAGAINRWLVTRFLKDVVSYRGKRKCFHVPSGLVTDKRQIVLLGKHKPSEYFFHIVVPLKNHLWRMEM